MTGSQLPAQVRHAPTAVGAITLGIGAALLADPHRAGAPLGLEPGPARVIGLADLALVPGLLRGRPRWPWMVARAALNVAIASHFARVVRRTDASRGLAAAGALTGLTVADSRVARQLRAAGV